MWLSAVAAAGSTCLTLTASHADAGAPDPTRLQLSYTTAFGWYAAFLLLRTGSAAAPITCHAFCNAMGLPRLGALARYPQRWQRLTAAAALVGGILGFAALLRPLTSPCLYGWAPGQSWGAWLASIGGQ